MLLDWFVFSHLIRQERPTASSFPMSVHQKIAASTSSVIHEKVWRETNKKLTCHATVSSRVSEGRKAVSVAVDVM